MYWRAIPYARAILYAQVCLHLHVRACYSLRPGVWAYAAPMSNRLLLCNSSYIHWYYCESWDTCIHGFDNGIPSSHIPHTCCEKMARSASSDEWPKFCLIATGSWLGRGRWWGCFLRWVLLDLSFLDRNAGEVCTRPWLLWNLRFPCEALKGCVR